MCLLEVPKQHLVADMLALVEWEAVQMPATQHTFVQQSATDEAEPLKL